MAVLSRANLARALSVTLTALLASTAGAWGQSPPTDSPTAPPPSTAARAHWDIGTPVARAQTAFDRGLLMLYAFNVGEARAAFRAAEAADPHAALAYVGEALAETIDINRPTTPQGERRGADAIDRGRAAAAAAPADQRAIFDAVAARFDPLQKQSERFSASFGALQRFVDAHPSDGTAATLAAYAGWNATGALVQGSSDDLTSDARKIIADLDRAIALDPSDAGAHHLRIHFWEQAQHPERALPDADYLASLTYDLGESHLQHMAGHTYDRIGDYGRMIAVNEGACANDDAYFARGNGDGQKYMRTYHEHDVDFVLYGLTTVGRFTEARAFAAHESDYTREHLAQRMHDSRLVLELLGAAITPMRAIAEARAGDVEAARKDLASLRSGGGGEVDYDLATGAVARAAHDGDAAVAAYRKALAAAGADLGDPKILWWSPIGEGLGAALLEAGQPAAAEGVFRSELARCPNDPHLAFGLAEALARQAKDDGEARRAYLAGWKGSKPLDLADLG